MSESCVLIPRVKSGEVSPLYTQLKEYFQSGSQALHWYKKATSEQFKDAFPKVRMDKYGEPILSDLIEQCGLKQAVTESEILSKLEKKYNTESTKDYNNVMALQEKASEFNRTSLHNDIFSAVVEEEGDKIKLRIKPNREVSQSELKKMEYNVKLNRRLEELLKQWNIEIANLTKLEERLGLGGITDFSIAKRAATGIRNLIRLAKGKKGVEALPEEVAHFAIEAMEENPLKSRSINALKNEKILRQILGNQYDNYYTLYNGDLEVLAKEALGKLVAQALMDPNILISNKQLFERYLNSVKNFFTKYDDQQIDSIMNQVMEDVYQLANNIINNQYKIRLENVKFSQKMANFQERVERDSQLLKNIIEQELKRLKIYGKKEEFSVSQSQFINELREKLEQNQALDGIYDYLSNSGNILKMLDTRLRSLLNGDQSFQEKFQTLRNIRNYISSYGVVISQIQDQITDATLEGDNRFREKLKVSLDQNLELIGELGRIFLSIAKDEFSSFLEQFTENGMVKLMRDGERIEIPVKELIEKIDSDISIVDRWIDSMADSQDPILQLYNTVVTKQRGEAKLKITEIVKDIQAETILLEQSGFSDTSFVAERDKEGNITGRFINKIWWSEFYKEKEAFFKSLEERYSGELTTQDKRRRSQEITQWYKENTEKNQFGLTIPNSQKYANPDYERLSDAQKRYLEFMVNLKHKLDLPLPNSQDSLLPQVRKSFAQRMLQNKNKLGYTWESVKDSFVIREDDLGVGNQKVLIDFQGNEVMKLPVYFTSKLADMNDLSLDIASTMMAYTYMSVNFDKMNEVVDALEIGREVLAQREVNQRSGNRQKVEAFDILGYSIKKPLIKKGEATQFMQKLNSFMEMQVYDRQMKDEGTIGKTDISVGKSVNFLNKITSLGTTAASLLTGIANLAQNWVTSTVESAAGQFFGKKDLLLADGNFFKELPSFLGQIGKRVKTNKLDLFDEMFDVMQDFTSNIMSSKMYRKNRILRLFNSDALYLFTHMGDLYTQNRVAIALAKNYKMLYNGEETNLWDVLEVEYRDKNNPELGATLKIKDGATKEDGSQFTQEDIVKFQNHIRQMQNRLFGIYNSQDKNALQQYSVGRLVMMYRNWMRPLYLTRFGKGTYNYDLQDYTEGYYRTFFRVLKNAIKEIRQGQFELGKIKDNLTDLERSNMKRAFAELIIFATVNLLIGLLSGDDDDDDKEKPWALRTLNYSLIRLRTDMGALMPTPTILTEAKKIIDDPFAAASTLGRILNLFKLLDPDSYTEEIESGMYKGYYQYQKVLIDLLPFRRAIVNALDPSGPAKWYK